MNCSLEILPHYGGGNNGSRAAQSVRMRKVEQHGRPTASRTGFQGEFSMNNVNTASKRAENGRNRWRLGSIQISELCRGFTGQDAGGERLGGRRETWESLGKGKRKLRGRSRENWKSLRMAMAMAMLQQTLAQNRKPQGDDDAMIACFPHQGFKKKEWTWLLTRVHTKQMYSKYHSVSKIHLFLHVSLDSCGLIIAFYIFHSYYCN